MVLVVILLETFSSNTFGQSIKLSDIVGGGNGTTGGVIGSGIDPSTGGTNPPQFYQISQTNDTDNYHPSSLNFVDGVFIPDGGVGAVTLDSSLHTFSDFPNTDANSWDIIKNGPNQNSGSVLGGVNFNSGPHSMVGLHANKGITFDLQEIAAANPSKQYVSFTTVVGMTHQGGDYGTGDWWIFLDGVLKQSKTNAIGGVGTFIDLALNPVDRFLTLVATDAGDGFSIDQIIFGDPLLHPSLPGDFNGNHRVDAADYTVWRNNFRAPDDSSLHGNGDGVGGVDLGDYNFWKQNYSMSTFPAGFGSLQPNAVPEPALPILFSGMAIGLLHLRRVLFALRART